jgi:hypothetical protein
MEGCTELQVTAMQCADCGTLSERPRARCEGHAVEAVTVTKRFFKCGGCGGRASTLSRRMPNWGCDGCRGCNWQACSMYSKRKASLFSCAAAVPFGFVFLVSCYGCTCKWL